MKTDIIKNKYFFTLVFASLLLSCNNDRHDGAYLKDKKGNIYQLEHRIGRCYFINEVNSKDIDSLNNTTK